MTARLTDRLEDRGIERARSRVPALDLVLQGEALSAAALPLDALGLSLEAPAEPAAGVVRLRRVSQGAALSRIDALRASGLDVALVRSGLRLTDMKLFASDLDSTLCATETLDAIAKNAGFGDSVAKVTEAAMRGEIRDYAESLRQRVKAIAGCPVTAFTDCAARLPYNPGAEALMAALKAAGVKRYIVTGGFEEIASAAAAHLAADGWRCNWIEKKEGRLTGRVLGPVENGFDILDLEGKCRVVEKLGRELGAGPSEIIAIGDGWNDTKMLAYAGLGIAYHAKPRVRALVSLQVNHLGLDSILNWFEDGPSWRKKAGF